MLGEEEGEGERKREEQRFAQAGRIYKTLIGRTLKFTKERSILSADSRLPKRKNGMRMRQMNGFSLQSRGECDTMRPNETGGWTGNLGSLGPWPCRVPRYVKIK